MNITTNNIGNYSLSNIAAKVQQKAVAKDVTSNVNISNKEKEFFTNLYPAQRDEIVNYHFYSSKGEMSGVAVGKNIDRRM
jgi:3-dehydroquinate dehydratase